MIIGVPRERKLLEKRVALTPDGAEELIKRGHTVLIEEGAGNGSFFPDNQYKKVGCTVVSSQKEVWIRAELLVKVKEPHESEYEFFRPGLMIFDYLHLASMPDLTRTMVKSGVTGIAYELVQTADKRLPLLEPMSEVAGKLAVLNGSYFLLSQNGGRGMLLGGTIGSPPARVTVIGAGIAGRAACEVALGMGAQVNVLDISTQKLEQIKFYFQNRANTLFSTKASIARACAESDIVIGAVLIPGAAAPKLVTREVIQGMKEGSVFVDISIDQGGCAETIRTTSLKEPTFVEHGVIHYGVPNMPAQTPRTSTMALTAVTLPYVMKLAEQGMEGALTHPELRGAINTHEGKLTNKQVGESLGMTWSII